MTDFTILRCINCGYYSTVLEAYLRNFHIGRCGHCGEGFEIAFAPSGHAASQNPVEKPNPEAQIDPGKQRLDQAEKQRLAELDRRWLALPQSLKDIITKYSVSSRMETHQLLDDLQEIFAADELQQEFYEFVEKRGRVKELAQIGAQSLHSLNAHTDLFGECTAFDCALIRWIHNQEDKPIRWIHNQEDKKPADPQ